MLRAPRLILPGVTPFRKPSSWRRNAPLPSLTKRWILRSAWASILAMPIRWFAARSFCPTVLGKTVRVLVFAKGEKVKEALDAGADYAGGDELVEKIKEGWLEFDKTVATPDMMGAVGKIGKILGPRGLMPNAKIGTVTFDLHKVVNEIKAGKVDFRVEKTGIVHAPMGKVSFGQEKLIQNISAFLDTLIRLKPSAAKGTYLRGIAISTTMGPGIQIDPLAVKSIMVIVPDLGSVIRRTIALNK